MHRSKLPLTSWLLAAWLLVTDKRGIFSVQLAKQLGTTQETAYMMLHKLRAAMVSPTRSLLAGRVEVDETYIGAKKRGRADAETLDKILVVGAVELRERKYRTKAGEDKVATWPGRIRLRQITGRTALELQGFVLENVAKGSHVVTDGLKEYDDLDGAGYLHEIESTSFGDDHDAVLPHLHTVFSNLKAYLKGTHHGSVYGKHIQAYINECIRSEGVRACRPVGGRRSPDRHKDSPRAGSGEVAGLRRWSCAARRPMKPVWDRHPAATQDTRTCSARSPR